MTRHKWLKRIARRFGRRGVGRFGLQMGVLFALGTSGAFASETGTNLPWEGPLTTLVTSLTGPVAYAISVIAIVALGATLAFAGGEMGETMKRLLHVGIAVCCVVFAAQVMTSFIGQSAEVATLLQPLHPAISILGDSKIALG
jgi:type IV secretion system protein TrbC